MQTGDRSETLTRKRIRLADIDFEPAHPSRHEVVHHRSDGSAETADDAVQNRENNNGAEAHAKAHHFRGGGIGPAMPVSEPATMEKSAMQIPTRSPRNAYTTSPTLNADPGPTRLKVAMCASFGKSNGWDASRMNIPPKALNREPSLIRP